MSNPCIRRTRSARLLGRALCDYPVPSAPPAPLCCSYYGVCVASRRIVRGQLVYERLVYELTVCDARWSRVRLAGIARNAPLSARPRELASLLGQLVFISEAPGRACLSDGAVGCPHPPRRV